jgi:hypothetical protein
LANAFQSDVRVDCKGTIANGRASQLLCLAAECGTMWLSKPKDVMPRTPSPLWLT